MLHIFDIDHTIYSGSTVKDFLLYRFLRGKLSPGLILTLPVFSISFLTGRGIEAVKDKKFSFLTGMSQKELQMAASEIFIQKIMKNLNPGLLQIIGDLIENKKPVALATSSFSVLVEPIARHLKTDLLFATELEFKDGISTGRLCGTPVFGPGKKEVIQNFLERQGILPINCTFYSDSHRDLPLLEYVGIPVAVNPDRKLRAAARKRNWEIIN